MILTRTPLRITLGGGGTDLPAFYTQHGGFCLTAAIDKYVYVALNRNFDPGIILRYSQTERVAKASDIEHPLARECFAHAGVHDGVEVSSMADIPAGTGLGSSGAYTVGLLRALYAHRRRAVSAERLAEWACEIEMDWLAAPVGKQDAYACAHGGLAAFQIDRNGAVSETVPGVSDQTLANLEDGLCLFFTGVRRSAADELAAQSVPAADTLDLGWAARDALEADDLDRFAGLLTAQWDTKRRRAPSGLHETVNGWIKVGCEAGASGGKLVGAGGGGFLLFFAERKSVLRRAMADLGLPEVRFSFDDQGSVTL